MKKTALVLGGGGFIGGHLAKRLKEWEPSQPLRIGMEKTYEWVNKQVNK